jgi:hypothetical protein
MPILDKTRFEFENSLIERTIIDSSNILASDYDLKNQRLYVYFKYKKTNTYMSCYSYEKIDLHKYSNFIVADSQGQFLSKHIKTIKEHEYSLVKPPFEHAKPIIEIEQKYKTIIEEQAKNK